MVDSVHSCAQCYARVLIIDNALCPQDPINLCTTELITPPSKWSQVLSLSYDYSLSDLS